MRYHYTALGAVAVAQRGNFDGTFREDQQWNPDGLGNLFQSLSDLNTTNSCASTGKLARVVNTLIRAPGLPSSGVILPRLG